ncbi:RNA polymerase sigma-70 factor [Ramlibacter algicola]|uniref:RNA polymerase sigma-70 factor n=1 Tax=Ramlibacter algicola TaxID=2795217 RepID=A0A934PXN4_9BURK|nr:RNA polymerase sigma-70 factor [Ramlibacter algicola]MBK0391258.1 RNA polymerase sigma-70 factor [Ramlibacter algicola]
MDQRTAAFQRHRSRLFSLAYRMLGSRADAEDVLQDAWLRWNESDTDSLRTPEAWLVTVTTRLALDRLRHAKVEREAYTGHWLPEPLVEPLDEDTPQDLLERADDISVALLRVLETLAPAERAAFVLRQAFDTDYAEIAALLGRNEAACRQLVHRATERVQEVRRQQPVDRGAHRRLLEAFAAAAAAGDLAGLRQLFADDVALVSDGGGRVSAFVHVLRGAQRLAQLYYATFRRAGDAVRYVPVRVNGGPGLARYFDGRLESVQAFDLDADGRIVAVYVQRNPDKLRAAAAALSQAG